MDTQNSRSVYRYFEPADLFVRIRVCDATALSIEPGPELNRSAYRRLVLAACLPDLAEDLDATIEAIAPDDPLLLEDLLYQLCVEVNPVLDIHTVRLDAEHSSRRTPAGTTHEPEAAPRPERLEVEDFRERLRKRSRGLTRRLERRIVGQRDAIETLSLAVQKAAVGLTTRGRPLGAFLFVGRTGTGKTELARALADELYGSNRDNRRGLIRIDCAEYALAHEYAKLIGAPPGYVGHEDGGQLTEAVIKNPESIVLFDEVEKANPRLHNLMLSILEDGCLTDSKGRKVSFERTLVLLTSNAGASEMVAAQRRVGFERTEALGTEHLFDIATDALQQQFSPEFLGRLDETVLFEELDVAAAEKIAQRQLTDLARRAREAGLRVAFAPSVAKWVARQGWSVEYGAREIRRVVRREIESPLSQFLLDAGPPVRGLVRARIRADGPSFQVED